MERKAKWDWSAAALVGIIFSFMGSVYTTISIILFLAPADPDAMVVRTIFLPLGLGLFLSGAFLLARAAVKKYRADQLAADGRYVWATVTQLKVVRNINGFRGHPVVLLASYTDAYGQNHEFQSRHLYRHPGTSVLGKSVKVYIQGSNYTQYYMDPDPLLQRSKVC